MRCPVCEEGGGRTQALVTDFLLGTTRESFQLIRCPSCTALYLDRMPGSDELAAFYPQGYWWEQPDRGAPAPARWLHRLEGWYKDFVLADHVRFVRRCARVTPHAVPVSLLDIGCGAGSFLYHCRRHGFAVRGLDTSERAARHAARAYGIDVTVGAIDATNGVSTAHYDVITMFHVLEHLRDPVRALRTAAAWLAPGGDLILQVPNADSLQARLFKTRWYGLDPPRHLINFNRRSLEVALGRAGFRLQAVRYFSLRDNAPALVSSLFPGLDPMARTVRRLRSKPDPALKRLTLELIYFALVAGAQPLAWLESGLRRGATMMVHAKKESGLDA